LAAVMASATARFHGSRKWLARGGSLTLASQLITFRGLDGCPSNRNVSPIGFGSIGGQGCCSAVVLCTMTSLTVEFPLRAGTCAQHFHQTPQQNPSVCRTKLDLRDSCAIVVDDEIPSTIIDDDRSTFGHNLRIADATRVGSSTGRSSSTLLLLARAFSSCSANRPSSGRTAVTANFGCSYGIAAIIARIRV